MTFFILLLLFFLFYLRVFLFYLNKRWKILLLLHFFHKSNSIHIKFFLNLIFSENSFYPFLSLFFLSVYGEGKNCNLFMESICGMCVNKSHEIKFKLFLSFKKIKWKRRIMAMLFNLRKIESFGNFSSKWQEFLIIKENFPAKSLYSTKLKTSN